MSHVARRAVRDQGHVRAEKISRGEPTLTAGRPELYFFLSYARVPTIEATSPDPLVGAFFADRHPDLCDDVIAEAQAIEDLGLTRWATREPVLGCYRDLAALEAHVHDRTIPGSDVDAVFAALLRIHHWGDARAGRVVVGLLLPTLARHRRRGPDSDEHLAQLVAELWHGICHYPIDRRPHAIAANLTLDARRRANRTTTTAAWSPLTDSDLGMDRDGTSGRVHDRLRLAETARAADISDRPYIRFGPGAARPG